MEDIQIVDLFDLEESVAGTYLFGYQYPWEALGSIEDMILQIGPMLDKATYTEVKEHVWIANSVSVYETACINGPAIIDEEAQIRHCAFIRGNAIIGKNAVVGNSTELKNVILFNGVQVPHYNYVGDSILGYKSHMGAGSITSNVKSDKSLVCIKNETESIPTNRKKVGAFLGDNVEIGCNSVLNPGTVIGRNSIVYPLSMVRHIVAKDSIYKGKNEIIKKEI